jgi:hypothetical protein
MDIVSKFCWAIFGDHPYDVVFDKLFTTATLIKGKNKYVAIITILEESQNIKIIIQSINIEKDFMHNEAIMHGPYNDEQLDKTIKFVKYNCRYVII